MTFIASSGAGNYREYAWNVDDRHALGVTEIMVRKSKKGQQSRSSNGGGCCKTGESAATRLVA
jgi:hypothetical protein